MIGDHLEEFGGLRVVDWPLPADEQKRRPRDAAGAVAWRVATESYGGEESWPEAFARFAAGVDLAQVTALVVGVWPEAIEPASVDTVVAALVDARDRLPALRALFFGDITYQEAEISWIVQTDLTPLLKAFPALEVFGVRGGRDLAIGPLRHERLRELVVQSGGLDAETVRAIAACDFPALTSLELWLGTPDYGGDSEMADLAPFMTGVRLPALRHLALRNSDFTDEIAAACASAPVVARLEGLDLSMGVLGDEGALALLGGQPLTHLARLDLHHNYLSAEVVRQLRDALEPAGVVLDLAEGNHVGDDEDEDGNVVRYVAVGE